MAQARNRAISKVGGVAEAARRLRGLTDRGLTTQAVSQWVVVPPAWTRHLAELCDEDPSVHDLRPDVFGPAPIEQATEHA